MPAVHTSTLQSGILGMILTDLGPPARAANTADAATAAVRLHTTAPIPELNTLDETTLRALPDQALDRIDQLHQAGPSQHLERVRHLLAGLRAQARRRAAGAERPPYGLCHGELHPTALHIGPTGWHLLDLALAHNGPGLLDLASWQGTSRPPDPAALNDLIDAYQTAGGHPDTHLERGGLPATVWALGWHRIFSALGHLDQAARDARAGDTNAADLRTASRQLDGAANLLGP